MAGMARIVWSRLRGGERIGTMSGAWVGWNDVVWAWLGSALSILCLAWLERLCAQEWNLPLLIGSFGASAVLAFGAPESPLAQPRNLVGGHMLSALVGVSCQMLLGQEPAAAAALAVSTAIALMRVTKTLHPPGGATALIAVIGGADIHRLGYWHVLLPCGAGACCMLLLALLTNNLGARRRYPQTWW